MQNDVGEPKTRTKKTVTFLVAVFAVLLVSALALGFHFLVRRPEPRLAVFTPRDAQLYVEISDPRWFLAQAMNSDGIDPKELDPKAELEKLAEAIADAFGLSTSDARSLLEDVESVAWSARGLEPIGARRGSAFEQIALVRFASEASLESLLRSDRFERSDRLFEAHEYRVTPALQEKAGSDLDYAQLLTNQLAALETTPGGTKLTRGGARTSVVALRKERLLVVGTREMALDVARVAARDKSALADSERFRAAAFERGAGLLVYVDPETSLGVRADFFDETDPWFASAQWKSQGLLATAHVELKGDAVYEGAALLETSELTLADRLPEDTLAYVALSCQPDASPKEAAREILRTVDALDPHLSRAVHQLLAEFEREYDGTLTALLEALGAEVVVGFVPDSGFDPRAWADPSRLLEQGAIAALIEVRDPSAAEDRLRDLRAWFERKTEGKYVVAGERGGFTAEPVKSGEDLPELAVSLEDRTHVVIAIGRRSAVQSITATLRGGRDTLKKDEAHRRARLALPKRLNALFWLDSGRLADVMLKQPPARRKAIEALALPLDAVRLEGDRRFTSALGLVVAEHDGGVALEWTTLNAPLLLLLPLTSQPPASSSEAEGKAAPAVSSEPVLAGTGIRECDDYLATVIACSKNMSGNVRLSLEQTAKTFRESFDQNPDPIFMRGVCVQAKESLVQTGLCQ